MDSVKKTNLVAVIGDVVSSKRAPDRAALQDRFLSAVTRANQNAHPLIAFEVTGGDELKALFATPAEVLRPIRDLTYALAPVGLRFGIGHGGLSTPTAGRRIGEVDGPCLHAARAAVEEGEKAGNWVTFRGFAPRQGPPDLLDRAATDAYALAGSIRAGWTDKQRTYARAYESSGTLTAVAERYHLAPSTVHAAIVSSRAREVMRLEESALALLALAKED